MAILICVFGRIESDPKYEDTKNRKDVIALLKTIRMVMYNFQVNKDRALSVLESTLRVHRCKQQSHHSDAEYWRMFNKYVDVAEDNGGSLGLDEGLIQEVYDLIYSIFREDSVRSGDSIYSCSLDPYSTVQKMGYLLLLTTKLDPPLSGTSDGVL